MHIADHLRTVENICRDENVGTVDDKRIFDHLTRPDDDNEVTATEVLNYKEI